MTTQLASFENNNPVETVNSGTKIAESKAVAQIQACILMAKRAPRNEHQCFMDIISACKRPSLADQAVYAYPRGKTMVTGASIRLAEVLAQKYGNIHIEISIISQTEDQTEAMATAIDMQSTYVVSQGFIVPHKRTTKMGTKKLTDERDIREMVQNIGSRILRGCILRVIPGDITEAALQQCKKTQESSDVPLKEQLRNMIKAFDDLGVKVEHLEKRLGHNLDATIPAEIVTLKSIYKSLKDGMADRSDFFDFDLPNKDAADKVNNLIKDKKVNATTGEILSEDEQK